MPLNTNNNNSSSKDNQSKQSVAIRKSILRNPEVTIRAENFNEQANNDEAPRQQKVSFPQTMERYQSNSHAYHQPRPNMINQICDNMKELTVYEAKNLESIADLPKDSQYVAKREVKSTLTVYWSSAQTRLISDHSKAKLSIASDNLQESYKARSRW